MRIVSITLILICASIEIIYAQSDLTKIPNYSAHIQKENLGRGLIAIHKGNGNVFISWRYLESDPIDTKFDLYRQLNNGKLIKLNREPISQSTWFKDTGVNARHTITYILKRRNENLPLAQYKLTPQLAQKPYLSIPMQQIPGDHDWRYAPNDASVGDLDGDGEYELVIKRDNGGHDNAFRGLSRGTTYLEAYKLNGTFMWRVDLGPNIRQGAHYTWFIVYDFDGDGKAEVVVRTSEGTQFGDGTITGDTDYDGITDYVDRNPQSPTFGKIMLGPEFLSVIDGITGKELARTNYISRGEPNEFGDTEGNRVDRFLGGIGYFDGIRPSILMCRGYYAKTVLEAWDYRDGNLQKRWTFSTTDNNGLYKDYEGQGNHNLSIGDVDGDGKDEIIYGACMINHDGTGGYNTRLGHGDAIHLTDIDIDRPGLEVWTCHEGAPNRAGSELRDARTGQLIWGIPAIEDVGRALAADIDPRFRGCEVWTISSGGVYTADGRFITERTPSINMAVWWTGDLNRELLDGSGIAGREYISITKWNGDGVDTLSIPYQNEIGANNHTKANPCLHADILGDWREEIIVRNKNNKEVRIYMTPYETNYRFHTLMSDIIYRISVANQNVAYNQPSQTGFYLGSDLGKFWRTSYFSDRQYSKSGVASDGRPNGMNARLKNATIIEMRNIITHKAEFTLDAGYYYDNYEWIINGNSIKGGRYLSLKAEDYDYNTEVEIIIKTSIKGCVFQDFGTITFKK